MVNKCCVPGCRSIYHSEKPHSTFHFPKNEKRRFLWIRAIRQFRKMSVEFVPTTNAVVCIHHFEEKFIKREDRVMRDDGNLLVVKRAKIGLTSDAVPSIPSQPLFLSKEMSSIKPNPTQLQIIIPIASEKPLEALKDPDIIESFKHFCVQYSLTLQPPWLSSTTKDFVLIYKLKVCEVPKILLSVKIFADLSVKIWSEDVQVDIKLFTWLLGPQKKCNTWSKFNCLINCLLTYQVQGPTIYQKLGKIKCILESCINDPSDEARIELQNKLKFLKEQVDLLCMQQKPRYSRELLEWSCKIHLCSPIAYRVLRNSKVLVLPHPRNLQKLASEAMNSKDCEIEYQEISLKRKADSLEESPENEEIECSDETETAFILSQYP